MHPEVREEQAYFDRALELRERVEANLTRAANEVVDPQTARDLRRRVGALGVVDPNVAVAFGRIDVNGTQWYIGKGAIWDEGNELVVVNWQAPVAAPFYRATPDQPEGIDARRIYRCAAGNRIRDIDEQVFAGLQKALLSNTGTVPRHTGPAPRQAAPSAHPTPPSGSVPVVHAPAPVASGSTSATVFPNGTGSQPPVRRSGSQPVVRPSGSQPPVRRSGSQPVVHSSGSQPPVRLTGPHAPVRHSGSQPVVRHTGPVDVAFGSGATASAPPAPAPQPSVPTPRPASVTPPVTPQSIPSNTPEQSADPPEPRVSDALLDALSQSRTGELGDIVATIQAAQYEVITRDIEQLLVVQGGPGTGKTVVGLHRASWMLFNRRDSWQPNDVLVVGPNPGFIRYISSVLPSLGDDAVDQLPVTGLGPRIEATRTDSIEVRRLKGDRRMQRLLLRAVRNRQKPQRGPIDLTVAGRTVRLDGERVVAQALQLAGQPHNEARRTLRAYIIDEVQTFFTRRGLRGLSGTDDAAQAEATREIDDYLERIWPAMTPQKFLVDLFSTRRRLEAAGTGLLASDEISMLSMPPEVATADAAWALDDIPLLDLADTLLNGSPPTYEHIVVDEAQDLSPMQFESIRRRSRTGWMTVLGDLAQATSPWSPESWEEIVLHLRHDRVPTEIVELSIGYRLPREVHEVAMRLLPEIGPRLRIPEPVRPTGHQVRVLAAHVGDVAWRVVEEVDHLLMEEGVREHTDLTESASSGLIGVLVAERDRATVTQALDEAGLSWASELPSMTPNAPGGAGTPDARETGSSRIVVLGAVQAKGLEFDNVIVVEPGEVAGESPQGLRALFVALTRTTNRLSLVHAEPLPSILEVDSPVPAAAQEPPSVTAPPDHSVPAPSPWEPVAPAVAPAAPPAGELSAPATPPNGIAPAHLLSATADSQGPGSTAVARHAAGSLQQQSNHASDGLETMDRAMARAVAGQLADAMVRYVTPSLLPLVLEELGAELSERGHADIQVLDVRDR